MRSKILAAATAGAVCLALTLASIAGARQNPTLNRLPLGTIHIEYSYPESGNNTVAWTGPRNSRLYVQVDDEPPELFASGPPGTVFVSWFTEGHVYSFTLKDLDGNVMATNELDLR